MPSNPKAVGLLDLSRFPASVSDAFLRRQNRTSNVTPPPVIDTFSRTERAPIPNAPALPSASLPV